ncbi:MAG: hypothetical protein ACYC59_07965 [Anaerolineaceae bacterium]
MQTTINKVNISYQYYYKFTKIISQGDYAFFSDNKKYENEFKRMLSGTNPNWKKPINYSGFWKHYLCIDRFYLGVPLEKSHMKIIPAFIPSIHKFTTEDAENGNYKYRVTSHCLIYPYSFCINVIIDLEIKKEKRPLEEVVKKIINTYYSNISFYKYSKDHQYSLAKYVNTLAEEIIKKYNLPETYISYGKYSSIAFVDGDYSDYKRETPISSDVHEWLSKLFYFNENLDKTRFVDLEKDNRFKLNKRLHLPLSPSSFYLENDTNRIIWMPAYFSSNINQERHKRIRTIKCYNKNLCMLTAQIKNLLIIVDLANQERIDSGEIRDGKLQSFLQKAINSLEKIFIRDEKTYKSLQSLTMISDKDLYKINYFRKFYFDKEPLCKDSLN